MTFIDIDNIKRAEAGQQQAVEQLEAGMAGRQRADEQVR